MLEPWAPEYVSGWLVQGFRVEGSFHGAVSFDGRVRTSVFVFPVWIKQNPTRLSAWLRLHQHRKMLCVVL